MAKAPEKFALTPRAFSLSLMMFPPIAMVRNSALDLAKKLAEHLELTDIHLGDEAWVFRRPQTTQGEPRGLISVTVEEQEIEIRHDFPTSQLERFESLVNQVVDAVATVTTPKLMLRTSVDLEYTTDVGGDAREMLLDGLKLSGESEESNKMSWFGRPCHLIGLRLSFPPYFEEGEDAEESNAGNDPKASAEANAPNEETEEDEDELAGADWQATVTIQSLPDEPRGISIEVAGHWGPTEWEDGIKVLSDRMTTVLEFLRARTIEFLKNFGGY